MLYILAMLSGLVVIFYGQHRSLYCVSHATTVLTAVLLTFWVARFLMPRKYSGLLNIALVVTATICIFLMVQNYAGRFCLCLGAIMNTVALAANSGFMPVDARVYSRKYPELEPASINDKRHAAATDTTRFRFLIDRLAHPLLTTGICSMGDVLAFIGLIAMAMKIVTG